MPSKRGSVWHVKRKLGPIGKVRRTLKTRRKQTAVKREEMLLRFVREGRWELLRAFDEGEVDILELEEARDRNQLGQLKKRLQEKRSRVSFDDALEVTERIKKSDDNIRADTWDDYEAKLKFFRDFVRRERENDEGRNPGSKSDDQDGTKSSERPEANASPKMHGAESDPVTVREMLDPEMVRRFKQHRQNEGMSNATINNDMNAIAALAKAALEKGWVDSKPPLKRYATKDRVRFLEPEQVRDYLNELRPDFRLYMRLLLSTGMRLGEAEQLRVHQVRATRDEPQLQVETSKTAEGTRPVTLPRDLAKELQAHIDDRGLEPSEEVFSLARRTVQKEHDRACDIVGLPDYTVHDHRHTAAVHLARSGTPLHLIKEHLGHRHIKSTMKYAKYHPDYGEMSPHIEGVARHLGIDEPSERRASGPED